MRILKMGSPSTSTATNMGIWQMNAKQRRRNKKLEHITRDCKGKQMIKKQKIQEGSDNEDEKNEQGFGEDLE